MPLLFTALILAQAAAPQGATPMQMPAGRPEPVCVRAGDLPPAFAKWNATPSRTLGVRAPFVATALPPAQVKWAIPTTRTGNGAVVPFRIARAGTYRIGLDNGAWIDVVSGGKALTSVAHGHGPACTGLRKIVDFTLDPGLYALQLADMPAATTRVMIVPR